MSTLEQRMSTEEKLDALLTVVHNIWEVVEQLTKDLERFRPLLEKYERAANASSAFKGFRELRREGRG